MSTSKNITFLYKYPFLVFFVFLVTAYLFVFLPFFHIKNDLITQNLPTRFFIGESLYSKTFPWWNPYINYGLPQYGDMNNGYWNPFLWIIARLFGYNVLSITLEEMLYILVGGWGIYKLSRQLLLSDKVAIICGLAYMGGGFILGHLQHFCWITGTAFFPYILLFFIRAIENAQLKNFILGGIAGFFFIASTHPGLIIGGIYFFFFVLFYLLFIDKRQQQPNQLYLIKVSLLFAAFIVLLSPIVWISDAEVLQHITRATKVSIKDSLMTPTTLQSYISLLFPLAINKGDFFYTDISMRNTSLEIILLIGIVRFFKMNTIRTTAFPLFVILFFILLASGGIFKTFAYHFLPLLGYVRLNGEFAYFSFLLLLLMGGIGLAAFQNNIHKQLFINLLKYSQLFFLISLIICSSCIYLTTDSVLYKTTLFKGSTTARFIMQNLSFWDLAVASSLLQLLFVSLYKRFFTSNYLLLLIAAHLIILTWLALPFTGLGQLPRKNVQAIINTKPRGIIKPYQKPVNQNIYINAAYDSIIGSAAFYSKQIGYPTQPEYPIVLSATDNFYHDSALVNFVTRQSYLFLSSDTTIRSVTENDSSYLQVQKYTPTFIQTKVVNSHFKYLIFLQNNYPRWKVFIDNKPVEHFTAFKTFIGIPISAGVHSITYQFDTTSLQILLWVNIIIVTIALLILTNKKLAGKQLVK